MNFSQIAIKEPKEVFEAFGTSLSGLSKKEVLLNVKKYGLNEIPKDKNHVIEILIRQVKSPFSYLLLAAAVISLFVGQTLDGLIVLLFIAINVGLGFVQEFRAERSISLLKKLIPQNVKVLRAGEIEEIEKKYLVPGDIVLLESGNIIPADLRLINQESLLVNESTLTGESFPVTKTAATMKEAPKEISQSENMVFSGTSIAQGSARGIVVATGKNTEFGKIIGLLSKERTLSAYEKNLIYFCRIILRIVIFTILLIFLINFIVNGTQNTIEFLLFCVALIVSILPEALPAVTILALSRGSLKMAKDHVVVKRLASIEDLGNIEVLCSDKTGTLTENKLILERIVSLHEQKVLLYALLGAEHSKKVKHQNPFDSAFLSRAGLDLLKELSSYTVLSKIPFDSFRMVDSQLVQAKGGEKILIVKGAPEMVLAACTKMTGKKQILREIQQEGFNGKRILALAYKPFHQDTIRKKDERGLTYLGYFVFEDPLKKTAGESIALARKLGVQIKIITGDSKEVSTFVAQKIGLVEDGKGIVLAQEIENLPADDFDRFCQQSTVFCRVSPEMKHRIVQSLQKKFEVGFLGEGVNDAPALKAANVGIAVSGASDVAKEAADVVLLRKDLRTIILGIKNGRVIFSNINKYIKSALASNFGNFYSIAVISLFIDFLPMLPIQILLGNLLSDLPLISIVSDSVDQTELRRPKMYELRTVLPLIVSLALVSTVFDFLFFSLFYPRDPSTMQTLWFIESILTELLLIFIIRTNRVFWKADRPGFWLLFFTVITALFVIVLPFLSVGQTFFHFAAPQISNIRTVFILVLTYFAVSEIVKLIYIRYTNSQK